MTALDDAALQDLLMECNEEGSLEDSFSIIGIHSMFGDDTIKEYKEEKRASGATGTSAMLGKVLDEEEDQPENVRGALSIRSSLVLKGALLTEGKGGNKSPFPEDPTTGAIEQPSKTCPNAVTHPVIELPSERLEDVSALSDLSGKFSEDDTIHSMQSRRERWNTGNNTGRTRLSMSCSDLGFRERSGNAPHVHTTLPEALTPLQSNRKVRLNMGRSPSIRDLLDRSAKRSPKRPIRKSKSMLDLSSESQDQDQEGPSPAQAMCRWANSSQTLSAKPDAALPAPRKPSREATSHRRASSFDSSYNDHLDTPPVAPTKDKAPTPSKNRDSLTTFFNKANKKGAGDISTSRQTATESLSMSDMDNSVPGLAPIIAAKTSTAKLPALGEAQTSALPKPAGTPPNMDSLPRLSPMAPVRMPRRTISGIAPILSSVDEAFAEKNEGEDEAQLTSEKATGRNKEEKPLFSTEELRKELGELPPVVGNSGSNDKDRSLPVPKRQDSLPLTGRTEGNSSPRSPKRTSRRPRDVAPVNSPNASQSSLRTTSTSSNESATKAPRKSVVGSSRGTKPVSLQNSSGDLSESARKQRPSRKTQCKPRTGFGFDRATTR